jgi:hypothetical protein
MKTEYKDRFGREICAGHKIRPYQEGYYGRLAFVRYEDGEFYIDIPEYMNGLELSYYMDDGASSNWEFEIVE